MENTSHQKEILSLDVFITEFDLITNKELYRIGSLIIDRFEVENVLVNWCKQNEISILISPSSNVQCYIADFIWSRLVFWTQENQERNMEHFRDTNFEIKSFLHIIICI